MSDKQIISLTAVLCAILLCGGAYLAVRLASPSEDRTVPQAIAKSQIPTPRPNRVVEADPGAKKQVYPQQRTLNVIAPVPQAVVAPLKPAKITGAAWLTTNGGSSNLMRGMSIAVLAPRIRCTLVAQKVTPYIPKWRALAQSYRKLAADSRNSAAEDATLGVEIQADDEKSAKEVDARAAQCEGTARRLQRWVQTAQGEMDLADAYKLLKTASTDGVVDLPLSNIIVAEATTNVDGKYVIASVPPGRYYLYGVFGSSTTLVVWLVPVSLVSGQELQVDLYNDNAATIRNSN